MAILLLFILNLCSIPMRCFIALEVPRGLWGRLEEVQKKLRGNVKMVEPENFHINLKFIGDVEDSKVGLIREAMDITVSKHGGFTVEMHGIGGFPHPSRPRVVWAGAKGDFLVQKTLEEELEKRGFPMDSREFKPHITLARVRFGRVDLPEAGNLGKFQAEEIKLIKSELTPSGPIYTVIHVAKFK
jgi:2'-5' RNA ligase